MAGIEYDSLEECPWQQLDIREHSFIIKCFKKKLTCEVLCSDFKTTWYEKVDAFAVMSKNATLNPSIETSADRLLQHVISILRDQQKVETKALNVSTVSKKELKITAESQLCGLPFSWEFNLTKCDDDRLREQLTKPLISMVCELSRRQQEFLKILVHKDAQIADYKAEGFKIPRKHKHEEPFDEKRFDENMTQSEKFKDIAVMSSGAILNPELQRLYTSIMSARNRHKHDLNLTNNEISPTAEQVNQTAKTAVKTEMAVSNKEMELKRRRALQTRLAEERTKKEIQSKNKKLKL